VSAALDLHLTAEQQRLYEDTRGLATRALKPVADQGQPGRVNRPLVRALAGHGLLARLFPATHAIDLCLIREALATACTEAETALRSRVSRRIRSSRRGRPRSPTNGSRGSLTAPRSPRSR